MPTAAHERPRLRLYRAVVLGLLAAVAASSAFALDLAEAIDSARREAPTVIQRRLDAEYAAATERRAQAARLPRASASMSATYDAFPPDPVSIEAGAFGSLPNPADPTSPISIPESDVAVTEDPGNVFWSLGVQLEQPIFTGGELRAAVETAALERTRALVDLDESVREAERRVRDAYYTVVYAEAAGSLVTEMVALAEANLADRREAFEEGTVNRQAVLEAELDLIDLESKATRLSELAVTARTSLAVLLGRPVDDELSSLLHTAAPDLDEEALLASAGARSTAVERAWIRAEQAALAATSALSGAPLRPTVGLRIGAEASGGLDTWNPTLRGSLSFSLPLFDGGGARAASDADSVRAEQARQGARDAAAGLALDVRRAVEAVRRAEAELRRADGRVALAAERRRNAEVSLANGLARPSDLRAAGTGELAARLERVTALFELSLGLSTIDYLSGSAAY